MNRLLFFPKDAVKISSWLFLCLILWTCNNGKIQKDTGKGKITQKASILFKSEDVGFKTAKDGQLVKIVYKFCNNSHIPLIIYAVKPGCGCTGTAWPVKPIQPGKWDSINVVFNTRGRLGTQKKYVVVFSNAAEKAKILSFFGEVKEKS